MAAIVFSVAGWQAVLLCFLFAIIYVGSLYVWGEEPNKDRDHPDTIRKRFTSVAVISVIVPPVLWCFGSYSNSDKAHSIFEWLGIRFYGFLPALIIPLLLTMVLFFGPLVLHYLDGVFKLYLEPRYWSNSFKNLIWLRNHVVAPFSEEFVFRACMLPLLYPSLGPTLSIFICPLFFGVAHFHHMLNKVILGKQELIEAVKQSVFQMFYTTIFGAYSAFLFLQTGHLIAPVIAHAFCNHMGFPAFNEVLAYNQKSTRRKLIASFVLGLVVWIFLLFPVTSPYLYSNEVYTI